MGVRVHATIEDWRTWVDDDTAEISASLLRNASLAVTAATRLDWFEVDPDTGVPVDASIAEALRDATLAQAEMWDAAGDDGTGAMDGVTSVSLGSVSESRDLSKSMSSRSGLCPAATTILRTVGLSSRWVQVYG